MEIIRLPRGGGKTNVVVECAMANEHGALLVFGAHERKRIIEEYKLTEEQQKRIFIASGAPDKLRGRPDLTTLYIDNLGLVLQTLFMQHKIALVTD